MAKDKPLTKTVLVKTLKQMGMITKKDLVNFATKDDLKNFATKDDLKNLATKNDLVRSERSLERRLVIRMNIMERGLRQSIADLAETTPTRQEFDELKKRVGGRYGFV